MKEKETINKGLFAALLSGIIIVAALGALIFFKGEAMLFAVTNEQQVLAEKERWTNHLESYGNVAEGPKE